MRVHNMICFPELPDKYYWNFHTSIYVSIHVAETDELIAWAGLNTFDVHISREGENRSYSQKGFESIQDAVDVMCTRVCLGMLYDPS